MQKKNQQKLYYKNEITCNANKRHGLCTSLYQVLHKNKNHCVPAELTPGGLN